MKKRASADLLLSTSSIIFATIQVIEFGTSDFGILNLRQTVIFLQTEKSDSF